MTRRAAYLDCVAGIASQAFGYAHPALVAADWTGRQAAPPTCTTPRRMPGSSAVCGQLCRPRFLLQFGRVRQTRVRSSLPGVNMTTTGRRSTSSLHSPTRSTGTFGAGAPRARNTRRPSARCCPACASPFNDRRRCGAFDDSVCAAIVEPVQGEGVHPRSGVLAGLRDLVRTAARC